MRVSVYPDPGGGFTVLVQASPGKGVSPRVLRDVAQGDLVDKVLPVVTELRGPRAPRQGLLSL